MVRHILRASRQSFLYLKITQMQPEGYHIGSDYEFVKKVLLLYLRITPKGAFNEMRSSSQV